MTHKYLANMPSTFDTWMIKCGQRLDIIPVCLCGAVEEIILVLSDELLKYYMEARNSVALK